MSDVDAVSLPAALDVGCNNSLAAVKKDGDYVLSGGEIAALTLLALSMWRPR